MRLSSLSPEPKRKLPLRSLLIVPFVLQIFAAVGLTGYFSLQNGERAVNDLGNQLKQETDNRINQNLNTFLATPRQINQLNASALKLNQIKLDDLPGLERHFWHQMQVFPQVTQISVGTEAREFVAVDRLEDKSLVIRTSGEVSNYTLNSYATDEKGNRRKLIQSRQNYDPRSRPWYEAAKTANQPTWSAIFPHFFDPTLLLPASQPVYDASGKLQGVLFITFQLSLVSEFLQSLDIGQTGQAFIIERSGALVATSTSELPFIRNNDTTKRLAAVDSQDPVTRSIAKSLLAQFGDFQQISEPKSLISDINGSHYLVRVSPLKDIRKLDWLVVVIMPKSDFMAQIDANTRTTILLCLGALMIAIILGIYTSRWITRPILRLQQASEAIATGDLDRTVEVQGIKELEALARSFNQMAAKLKFSFTVLEDRVAERTQELSEKNMQLNATLVELHRTQTQMIQSEKMSALGQTVAGIAHEINNPVSFIHGNLTHVQNYTIDLLDIIQLYQHHYPNPVPDITAKAQELELDFIQEDLSSTLSSMQLGTDRIREIILSLRNFSRLDESDYKAVNIHEGIDSTLLILQHRLKSNAERSAVQVVKDYAKLPSIECYPGQLNQVFMNVLANAIDALEDASKEKTVKGSPQVQADRPKQITIRTTLLDLDDRQWVEIAIADNGIGIPTEIQNRIFDPFFTSKPIGKGTGMGLSISYQIITEKHHGKLECHSISGAGTEFIIQIPSRQ